MSESARSKILIMKRLTSVHSRGLFLKGDLVKKQKTKPFSLKEKISHFKTMMETVQTEVHLSSDREFSKIFLKVLEEKGIKSLLYAKKTCLGVKIDTIRKRFPEKIPELISYGHKIENFRNQIFSIDAAITETRGGIVETGSLILWPSEEEPRLMSLIPPIHMAVLKAEKLYHDFSEVLQFENWSNQMPTNALLISGPSKTADIEQSLVYGVHGPKQLVVFVIHTN